MNTWLFLAGSLIFYGLVIYFLIFRNRRWNRKARLEQRLLVKEDGQYVWRTIKGRLLVGLCESNGEVTSGLGVRSMTPRSRTGPGFGVVIETRQMHTVFRSNWPVIEMVEKLVVYCFSRRTDDEPRHGTIHVCNSWRELEALVPANILEEALLAAGIKKPSEYRASPLKL